MNKRIILFAVLSLFLNTSHAEKIYQITNEKGIIVFSDKPLPTTSKQNKIIIKPAKSISKNDMGKVYKNHISAKQISAVSTKQKLKTYRRMMKLARSYQQQQIQACESKLKSVTPKHKANRKYTYICKTGSLSSLQKKINLLERQVKQQEKSNK